MPEDARPAHKYSCAGCGAPRDGLDASCAACGWMPAPIDNLQPVVPPPSDAKAIKTSYSLPVILALFFCIPSAFGFVASLVLHLATFVFISNPLDHGITELPQTFPLMSGIFVIGVPAVFAAFSMGMGHRRQLRRIMRELLPGWLHIVSVVIFMYAGFNFFFTIIYLNEGGQPEQLRIGSYSYVLQEHGRVIRKLTREEFYRHKTYEVRTVSGHLMAGYFGVLLIFHALTKRDSRMRCRL